MRRGRQWQRHRVHGHACESERISQRARRGRGCPPAQHWAVAPCLIGGEWMHGACRHRSGGARRECNPAACARHLTVTPQTAHRTHLGATEGAESCFLRSLVPDGDVTNRKRNETRVSIGHAVSRFVISAFPFLHFGSCGRPLAVLDRGHRCTSFCVLTNSPL